MINYFYTDSQKGGATLLIFIGVMTLMLGAMFNWLDSDDKQSVINKQGTEADKFTSTILNNARRLLTDNGGCGSVANDLKKFRDFDDQKHVVEFKGDRPVKCLISSNVLRWIDDYEVRFETIFNDSSDLLMKNVKVSVSVKTKEIRKLRSRTFQSSRTYRVTVLSLDKLGLVFFGKSSPRLASDGPVVEITSLVYDTDDTAKSLSDIYYSKNSQRIRFQGPLLLKAKEIKAGNDLDLSVVRSIYTQGVFPNAFSNSIVSSFMPKNSFNWNFGLDYSFVREGVYSAIPETSLGKTTVGCDPKLLYSKQNGNFNKVPDKKSYPSAMMSCNETMNPIQMLLVNRASGNFTIDLKNGDNIFCGIVTANELTVNLSGSGDYALFGLFNVKRLVVKGGKNASLKIHNPQDNIPEVVDLPGNTTQILLNEQMRTLASSVGRNYFLPISKATGEYPSSPDRKGFLQSCGGGNYRLNERYDPMTEALWYKKVKKPSPNTIYFVRDIM